jgi:signal transduction histidine kinase
MPRRLLSYRRTSLAATLVAVAVLVPTSAWYVSGSQDAERRARAQVEEAVESIRKQLEADANRLESRLAVLLARESERPFYHYQSLFHDPLGAAQGLAVVRSPLAVGTSDPMVWVHFQLDETGSVSLPTINERFPELSTDEGLADFCEVLGELQNGLVVAGLTDDGATTDDQRVTVLDRDAWEQIQLADNVYATLTGRETTLTNTTENADRAIDDVVIRVGPLRWHTVVLDSGPTLAALREVVTPDGLIVQGFVIATVAVSEWLGGDVQFTPMASSLEHRASTPVANTDWYLTADAEPSVVAAIDRAGQIRSQFRRTFGFGSAAALTAALAVVVILAQTDRLARQRARFAAAAAHELKTPLATLRLHSEMLTEDLGDPANARHYAERIAPEVRRLGRVVANMLDLSRLERGAALAQPRPGDVSGTVAASVERHRRALDQAGVTADLRIDPDLPEASFDHDALSQVLDNLLDNAEKHTRSVADRRVSVTVAHEGSTVTITVADNGPGIPGRVRRQLFRPFARKSEDSAGLGLGLALSRSLARAQGGDLVLESGSAAEGTAFVVTLPVA